MRRFYRLSPMLGSMMLKRLLLIGSMLVSTSISAFPEMPFCPLGGPTGWFNRMAGGPGYYPPPAMLYPPPYRPMVAPGYPPTGNAYPNLRRLDGGAGGGRYEGAVDSAQ